MNTLAGSFRGWLGQPSAWRQRFPGLVVAGGLAQAAGWIAGGLGDPLARNPVLVAMLFALLLGTFFSCPAALRPGLDFTKRYLLRLGVMLLGFRITLALLGDLGLVPITIAALELVTVLLVVRVVALRVFKLDPSLALLIATGAAVCGAAAILSMATLTRAREQQAGVAITLITVAGTLPLLVYPVAFMAGWMPGLDDRSFGVTVGASIFELAQVYGASFSVSEGALNAATLVKLSKVVMLVPLLVVFGVLQSARAGSVEGAATKARIPIPWFVLGFIAVLLFNSAVTVHPQLRRLILEGDQFLFMMVMVSLGLTTSAARLREDGGAWRLAGTGLVALAVSGASAYWLVRLDGLNRFVDTEPGIAAGTEGPSRDFARESSDGQRIFSAIGCAKCHEPTVRGNSGDVLLYSDLLLHDMGASLDDKIVQGNATGADWRTTPLVGLGLRPSFLHDGRATTLRDAVLDHGGEAAIVRDRFFELTEANRQALYRFLMAL